MFFAKQFRKQNKDKEKNNTVDDLQHLGFNAGEGGVRITEEVIKELEEQIKKIIVIIFDPVLKTKPISKSSKNIFESFILFRS